MTRFTFQQEKKLYAYFVGLSRLFYGFLENQKKLFVNGVGGSAEGPHGDGNNVDEADPRQISQALLQRGRLEKLITFKKDLITEPGCDKVETNIVGKSHL